MNTDNPIKAHANAYLQLATLQTKLDEDELIISALSQNLTTHADMNADMHRYDGSEDSTHCDDHRDDPRTCDGYDLAIEIIAARRKELNRELRKVKKRIYEIEGMWRG